MVTAPQFD